MSKTKPKTELLTATMANEPLPTCPVAAIKRYDENFRKSAVEHWIKTGQPGTQIATELGIIVPPIRVRDHLKLEPNQYTIRLRGVEVARGRGERSPSWKFPSSRWLSFFSWRKK